MWQKGKLTYFCLQAINYPTVARGEEKLRVAPTPHHTKWVNVLKKAIAKLAFQGNDGPVCGGLDQWMESPWPPSQPKTWSVSASVLRLLQVQCNPKIFTDQNVPPKTCTLQATSWVCATGSTRVPSCINRPGLPSRGTCHSCGLASYHLRLQVTLTYGWDVSFGLLLWLSTILNNLCFLFRGKQGGGRDPNIWFP